MRIAGGVAVLWALLACSSARAAQSAEEVLKASGIQGGLVVHLGCGDGERTAALRAGDSYLVHGLDTDAANVEKARARFRSLGLREKVSAEEFDGRHLPYADNLVNLLVAEDLGSVAMSEVMRVLCPGGVACIRSGGRWQKTVKPWPAGIDEWTHHLHDAGGNAVAADRVVGPPARLQWTAGPLWARSHGWTPSVSAMVSAGGRLFAICDETLTCVDGTVPSKWFVVARDAFSGVLLWKHPIPRWGSEAFSGTPDTGQGVTTGRFTMPPNVGKRLVAVGDTVFVTLGPTAPVTALDAATGKVQHVYAETERADEILCTDGRLIVSINPDKWSPDAPPVKQICAVEVDSGRVLWRRGPFAGIRASKGQDPCGRLELVAGDGKVFALTTETIECLTADSGESVWRIQRPALPEDAVRRIGFAGMYEYLLAVLVYHDGVVLLAQPEPNTHHTYHTMPGTLYAFDAEDGRQMWKHTYGGWGHCTPPDVFVVGNTVWTHVNAETEFGSVWGNGYRAKDPSIVDYRIQALDLRTGELRKELPTRDIFNVGHHHRCYRNKITERFLLSCRRGVEFVDLAGGENYQNHWVRGGCLLGYLPCNGLLYVAPHPCACYINAKLTGFNALAPKADEGREKREERGAKSEATARLTRGPAFDHPLPSPSGRGAGGEGTRTSARLSAPHSPIPTPPSPLATSHQPPATTSWPTYRHDAQRSGATESAVGADLKIAWRTPIGTEPSGLVVAGGKVLVAGVDTHTVYALDADDGKPSWQYTAGARVDSPPTFCVGRISNPSAKVGRISNPSRNTDGLKIRPTKMPGPSDAPAGLCIFGSADGRVYCLRAADGELVWRFDAAPRRRLVTAFGQLESAWPVPGSVLVHEGTCWFAAGRSSYLDGGISLYALDPATGEVLHSETIYSPDPETGKMTPEPSGHTMPGLLNDIPATDGANVFLRQMQVSASNEGGGEHLFTNGGYLDPSWFNRTFWHVGRARTSGLMVLGHDVAYGVEVYGSTSRETVFQPGANAYRLMCISLKPPARKPGVKQPKPKRVRQQGPQTLWQQRPGIRVTAMVRAADTLFVGGSPDIVDPADPHGAWEGREGGVLAAYDAADGDKLAEYKLPAPPVWDGMAAANGRLYISTQDGHVLCLTHP